MDFEQLVEQETRRLRADGRAEGLRDGRADGLRLAATDLCELLGIELTEARRTHLAGLDLPGLEALWRHLKTHRNWPA